MERQRKSQASSSSSWLFSKGKQGETKVLLSSSTSSSHNKVENKREHKKVLKHEKKSQDSKSNSEFEDTSSSVVGCRIGIFCFCFCERQHTHTISIKNTRTYRYGNVETSRGYNSERYFRETYNRVTFCERSLLDIRTYHGRYGGACTFSFCNHMSPHTRTPHNTHTHRYVYSGVPRIHHEMC